MVQVQNDRNGALFRKAFDGFGNIACTDFFVFQRAILEINTSTHKGVRQIGALQDSGGAEHFMDGDHSFCLGNGIDVKCPLRIAVF